MKKEIVVDNNIILEDPLKILEDLQKECAYGKLSSYSITSSGLSVPCPEHSGGTEKHNSCYLNLYDDKLPYLYAHCFTCGYSGSFAKFVGSCLNKSEEYGVRWLLNNYPYSSRESVIDLPRIELDTFQLEPNIKQEYDLSAYQAYHPYMTQRKLTSEVIDRFDIKYDPTTQSIVFPVKDLNGNIKYLTRRSVNKKQFIIDKNASKEDIYLLYDVLKDNLDNVYVCESQINALTLWGWGFPAIALLGAGCPKYQIEILNKVGINRYILALDNDIAGQTGTRKLIRGLDNSKLVDVVQFKDSRDINELTKEEFINLNLIERHDISLQIK